MNLELLARLYKQSHTTVPHVPTSGHDAGIEDRVFVPERFAELIIKDCVSTLEYAYSEQASIVHMVNTLKERFGVEL